MALAKTFTEADDDLMRIAYGRLAIRQLMKHFRCTYKTIDARAVELGLPPRIHYLRRGLPVAVPVEPKLVPAAPLRPLVREKVLPFSIREPSIIKLPTLAQLMAGR